MSHTGVKYRRTAAALTAAAALLGLGLGAGTADAAGWPPLRDGAYLYTGLTGTGQMTTVDTDDFGTCHTLSRPAASVQVVSGTAALELYRGADCTGTAWVTGSLAQQDLPWTMTSYRVRQP
ncbi:hypothetical protein AB0C52_28105 [Streptomyces sp. NPDC048717]|uniref:hypothetical protein n=1 Tax=Streptomyces sp. NPDC048717 TaxID=3154928 RepID=UPI0034284B7F